ncbi:MAG TPA: hypothetical protein VN648_05310, partial [Candidatus Methylomirabilis sp.]|nr:hypothetical protein [Candidatus Methylomirabilis sp.]
AISRGIRTGQGTLAGIVATSIEPDQLDSVVGIERAKQGGIGLIDKQGGSIKNWVMGKKMGSP